MSVGRWAEDLVVGASLPAAPSSTIDAGVAATYQAVVGDALRLSLSDPDARAVTRGTARVVNPALALQVAIGQSTVATGRVIANLFYRDVVLHRQPVVGDTLTSVVTPRAAVWTSAGVVGGRAKVLLEVETVDQEERTVARFQRVALLPVRDASRLREVGDVGSVPPDAPLETFEPFAPSGWDLSQLPGAQHPVRTRWRDPLCDTVSGALELVRLTHNLAAAHRDPRAGSAGRRLVYGGHVVGLAQASLTRSVPSIATVIGWRSCDHVAPVVEGDVLAFEITQTDVRYIGGAAAIVGFDVRAAVEVRDGQELAVPVDVLRWRPVVLATADAREEERA